MTDPTLSSEPTLSSILTELTTQKWSIDATISAFGDEKNNDRVYLDIQSMQYDPSL